MHTDDSVKKGALLREEKLKQHVLLIYREMIPSVRLCGHCQMEYLAEQGKAEYRAVQEIRLTPEDLNWAHIVILGRLDSWYEYQLAKNLHESGRYLAYIIDDDLLSIPSGISSAAYYGQPSIQGFIRSMIDMSDAVISPSPLLLTKYAAGKKCVLIEEPALNAEPYWPRKSDRPVRIGFAGSIDRVDDIQEILSDALLRIKRNYGDRVQFEFFGAIPSFADQIGAKCIPYNKSFDDYKETLNSLEWDIGLAPMPDTPFHACKHYNKFVEYAAAGTVGVFSEVYPYTRIRAIYPSVILCPNDTERWYEAIAELIENRECRERLRAEASALAQSVFSLENSAAALEQELLDGNVKGAAKSVTLRLALLKWKNLFYRGIGYVHKCFRG